MNHFAVHLVQTAAILWTVVALLPWRPWLTDEILDAEPSDTSEDLSDITVLIPARNEGAVIASTLACLNRQGRGLKVVVIDDESTDRTGEIARSTSLDSLTVICGKTRPEGWSGKLWALEQGRVAAATPKLLLLDADISLRPGAIAALRRKMDREQLHLVSLMAAPRFGTLWERLLMPAFVYFFKLIYPFRVSNSPSRVIAAAAGGCLLIDSSILHRVGGFSAIHDALIDDCTLARKVKTAEGRIWIGLTHCAEMTRCNRFSDLWRMIARTAFTQLRYSLMLLLLCTIVLVILFIVPLAGLFTGTQGVVLSIIALALMTLTYVPTLRFYGRSPLWALCLPAIGALYLAMTWASALDYARGRRSRWKGRDYPRVTGRA